MRESPPPPRPGGVPTSCRPPAGPSRPARVMAALRGWFAARDFSRSRRRRFRSRPATRSISAPSRPSRGAGRRPLAALSAHSRRNFPARSSSPPANSVSSRFARVFRNGERTALHHPEFTLLEWYRAGAPYGDLVEDCAGLLAAAADAAGADGSPSAARARSARRGGAGSPSPRRCATSPASISSRRSGTIRWRRTGRRSPRRRGRPASASPTTTGWADVVHPHLVEKVEPHLGHGRPTALMDYPASEAALARRKPDDPRLAERFELYACGCRARQCLRGAHRSGRAAAPLRGRHGDEGAALRCPPSDRRGFSRRARRDAGGERHRPRARSPRHARGRGPGASRTCCGRPSRPPARRSEGVPPRRRNLRDRFAQGSRPIVPQNRAAPPKAARDWTARPVGTIMRLKNLPILGKILLIVVIMGAVSPPSRCSAGREACSSARR